MHVIFISHPQYLIGILEVLFSIIMIFNSFNTSVNHWVKAIVIILVICSLLMCLFSALVRFAIQKNVNYGSFKINYDVIKEQQDEFEANIKCKAGCMVTSTRKVRDNIQYFYGLLAIVFIFYNWLGIGDLFVNGLGCIIAIFLCICEIFLNLFAISPFLFFLLFLSSTVIVNLVGIKNSILDWSFLTLIFITMIGTNFFDKLLVKETLSKEITEISLILRKISYYIGVIFLYIGIVLSNRILESTFYYIYVTSKADPIIHFWQQFILKSIIFLLLFAIYLGTEKKIIYLIFRFYYRDHRLKSNDSLVKVFLDKDKKWKVRGILKKPKKLKRISINTYQGKKENVFYVDMNSEIPEKIKGLGENDGKHILGVIDSWTQFWLFVIILIVSSIYFIDRSVRVDNGTYKIVGTSEKTDSSDTIEISGDTIIYNGKAETIDTRKQSFSMGKIKKKKGYRITIELYKNREKVHYTKVSSSGIPYELKYVYSGHSKESGSDKLIFSRGSSTLFFNKNENKITNKTKGMSVPYVVVAIDKMDRDAQKAFKEHKSEYKGVYFTFKIKEYKKATSTFYIADLTDEGETIQIQELKSSSKKGKQYNFNGNAR